MISVNMTKVICTFCGHEIDISYKCKRCGHEWNPRKPGVKPVVCPKCKSPYWDKPRRKKGGEK